MAQGLFIPNFRGAGTPGAPGVGSTRRGLETARQAEQITEIQQVGLQGTKDKARIDSIIRGAVLLKQQTTPENKERFLIGRIEQLEANGIDSSDSREALQILQSGDLAGLEELTDQAISLGQAPSKGFTLSPGQKRFVDDKEIASVAPKPAGLSPLQFKQGGIIFNPNDGTTKLDPLAVQRFDKIAEKSNITGKLDFKDKQSINKDITGLLKSTVNIANTARDLDKLGQLGGGPASIALVFKFMKALDPTSVVRESEFAVAENSAGVPEAVRNIFNKLQLGERLGKVQISQFVEAAQVLANTAIGGSSAEINSLLDTFGDTLPDDFKKILLNRVPKAFELEQKTPVITSETPPLQGPTVPGGEVEPTSDFTNQSDEQLLSF